MTLIIVGVIILLVWIYVMFGRAYLIKTWPDQYGWWHTIEDTLWEQSRTILVARTYQLLGWLLGLQVMLATMGIDTTPFTDQLALLIPEKYRPLAISGALIITGLVFKWLRTKTTQSVEAAKMEVKGV